MGFALQLSLIYAMNTNNNLNGNRGGYKSTVPVGPPVAIQGVVGDHLIYMGFQMSPLKLWTNRNRQEFGPIMGPARIRLKLSGTTKFGILL